MAIQISGTTVINNSKNLDTGLTSAYATVSYSTGGATLTNRTFRSVNGNGQTITLPASPAVGNEVCVTVQGNNNLNNIVARNGQRIMGLSENITLDIRNAGVTFLYTGSSFGWRVY